MFTYGDMCQITYNNYIRDGDALAAVKAGLSDEQKQMRSAFQTGCPLLGGFKYLPSELMGLPATDLPPPAVEQVVHRQNPSSLEHLCMKGTRFMHMFPGLRRECRESFCIPVITASAMACKLCSGQPSPHAVQNA